MRLLPTLLLILFVSLSIQTTYAEPAWQQALAELETAAQGHIGVFALNTATGQQIAYRAQQRFPLCSTSKLMGVAGILKASESNTHLLQKTIHYKKSDLVAWSPLTKLHIRTGMRIKDLSQAAMTVSDNTAINLLIQQLGGPQAVTAFARSLDDSIFRQDRIEPDLNSARPGDDRDTSTPKAMAISLQKLVLGKALAPKQRALLKHWLISNTTGAQRIRAGVPSNWLVGDKTGTCGNYGVTNDVAIIWPKQAAPIVLAIYYRGLSQQAATREDVLANATRVTLDALLKS